MESKHRGVPNVVGHVTVEGILYLHYYSFVFAIFFFCKSIETNLLQLAFWRRLFALVANLLLIKELDLDKLDFLSSYNSYHTIHMIAHRGAFFA